MQHLHGMATKRLQADQQWLVLVREFLQRSAANLVRHVADAFQLGNGFDDRHHQTQVAGGRLAFGDDPHAGFVNRHFHHIDLGVAFDHAFGQFTVLIVHRGDSVGQLLFHQPAHGQYLGADMLQFCVELAGNVLI
ncbi:hypothetical protein D3C71_1323670 [compost metagenome]